MRYEMLPSDAMLLGLGNLCRLRKIRLHGSLNGQRTRTSIATNLDEDEGRKVAQSNTALITLFPLHTVSTYNLIKRI